MGKVKTCQKYQNPITFPPTHKIFLDANHRPVVTGTDPAIWRRLKPVPFTVTIPEDEADKNLLTKLKAEASGVVAWAVKGCLDWQRGGLREPREIRESLEKWQCEDDPYREFFEDRCEFDPAAVTPVADMWEQFDEWAKKNGIKYPSRTRLYARLRSLGCEKDVQRRPVVRKMSLDPAQAKDPRTHTGGRQFRCWRGVKLI
jgi:putative DNA primase/helicase